MDRLARALAIVVAAWWLAVYLPGAGTGFVKDDFAWIEQSRVASAGEVVGLFGKSSGFYRPVVALSFACDDAAFGLSPLAYGLTNVLLAALAAWSLARLVRTLGLPPLAAVVAAAAWSLNPHGINMAVLWTSGRTALLLTLFATLAATAWLRGHVFRSAAWVLLALLSKEEAVALPFVLVAWSVAAPTADRDARLSARSAGRAVPLFLALAFYLVLRWQSGAFTPASAPPFYRFSSDWRLLAFNVFSYLDRAATFPAIAIVIATVAMRKLPTFNADTRRIMAMGAIWLVGGYALTVWLPVRSSLYATFPSVGAAVIAAAWVSSLVEARREWRLVPIIAGVCLAAIASTPIYWSRNERWLAPARLSASVTTQLPGVVADQPAGTVIVFRDRLNPRESLSAAFGTLLPQAVTLWTGRSDIGVWVEPPPGDWALAGWRQPQPGSRTIGYVLDGRTLRRVP